MNTIETTDPYVVKVYDYKKGDETVEVIKEIPQATLEGAFYRRVEENRRISEDELCLSRKCVIIHRPTASVF